jgi:hypothetical protein
MRALNLLFALSFLASVALQYNDPDPLAWMLIYGLAAVLCVGWERSRIPRWAPAVLAVAAGGWALRILLTVPAGVEVFPALTDWGMYTPGSEELREIGGLALVAIWMAALSARPRAG